MAIRICSEAEKIPITLEASRLGNDINISIWGGDKGHIGAVALAQSRPSLADPAELSTSTSVLTLCGHKEDRLACAVAEQVAVEINGVVSVACGIHIDHASAEQIREISSIVKELVGRLILRLRGKK